MLNTNERIIKHKVGLLNLAEELGNVSKACQVMGLSRDTFYRYKSAVEEGGVDALLEADRCKPNPKNRVEPKVEAAVTQYAIDFPAQALRYWCCTARKRASKAPSSANNSRYSSMSL